MKIISKANKEGKRFLYEDAIFDPSLMSGIFFDKDEGVVIFTYDALENGHPLGISPGDSKVIFNVTVTPTGVHTALFIADCDEHNEFYNKYGNGAGDIELDVRMTDSEKLAMMYAITNVALTR